MTNALPEKIGRYQVLERVGRGGMGVLFRGVDAVLDREVAIKLMLLDFSDDTEQMRPRFYREAKAAAKLQHPNIVTVFEFAEDNNTPYIVMEFLRGASLAERMASPIPLTLDDKLHVIAQLCGALHYAHAQGVVHRDIKPANVFLLTDGSVKLLDFGVAKLTTSTLTRQGDVLGSVSYMSPEQVSGSPSVDGRSDIFSVGVMLYELLAGRKPFQGDSPTATVVKILHEDAPPLDAVAPGLPAPLVAAVRKALSRDAAERFANAGELARELLLVRTSLQASQTSTAALDETRFATAGELAALQRTLESDRQAAAPEAGTAPGGPAPAANRRRLWQIGGAAAAAIVIVLLIGMAVLRPREGATAAAAAGEAAGAAAAADAPPPAPAAVPAVLQVVSVPAGAAIALDGQPTNQTTPAAVTLPGDGPHVLQLSRQGFVTQDARVTEADVQRGSVTVTLAAAPPTLLAVTIESTYPVEVWNGSRSIAAASASHRLTVAAGSRLRVRAPEYLLDAPVNVDGRAVDYRAPGLGRLTVLTRHETCTIKIGERALGFPPITQMAVAAGQYRVDIECPTGGNPAGQFVTVAANEPATVRVF